MEMGKDKFKTGAILGNATPKWNEEAYL